MSIPVTGPGSVCHPYMVGEAFSEGVWRRVYLGGYDGRALYLSRCLINGQQVFHIEAYYGAGSFAWADRADNCLRYWGSNGFLGDICAVARKAMAEWPS